MARYVGSWKFRDEILKLLSQTASEADESSELEYGAAVKIQSWFRGCRVRAYLAHLHARAVTIQCNYRGHLGREEYRRRLQECLDEMRTSFYYNKAVMIQRNWRGYYVRKFIFNYRAYKEYLRGVVTVNEHTRARIQEEVEQRERERQAREEHLIELQVQDQARRYHYLLGTATREGIFKKDHKRQSHPFEDRMRAIQFAPPLRSSKHGSTRHSRSLSDRQTHSLSDHPGSLRPRPSPEGAAKEEQKPLPPLVKMQGPFRAPEEVRRLRFKPFNPTLRVATTYNHQEEKRAQLKAKEWAQCIYDESFKLVHRNRPPPYIPYLHTSTAYHGGHATYGLASELRPPEPHKNISDKPFNTILKPLATFDELSSSY